MQKNVESNEGQSQVRDWILGPRKWETPSPAKTEKGRPRSPLMPPRSHTEDKHNFIQGHLLTKYNHSRYKSIRWRYRKIVK